jgi:signal transduction histidine kinase
VKFATRLAFAFALHIALLGVLLVYHVGTSRQAVTTAHELSEVSTRIQAGAGEQLARLAQLDENAAKFKVTRDVGYRAKFDELSADFEADLAALAELPLGGAERAALAGLREEWHAFAPVGAALQELVDAPALDAEGALLEVHARLDAVRTHTIALGEAADGAMIERLQVAALRAREAERISWIAAAAAMLLSVLVSILIVRSLATALLTLKQGTQQVARGRFETRLDTSRGDEFADVARDFNAMAARLGELDRMKRDFISSLSHDLKTPLASMQETTGVLRDGLAGPLTERQRRLLDLHHESGARLAAMLAKLLDLSSLEAGLDAAPRRLHELDSLLHRTAEHAGGWRRGAIRVDTPAQRVLVDCDGERIRQVVENLLENAAKFAPDDTPIDITLRLCATRPRHVPEAAWRAVGGGAHRPVAQITVADRGPGVEAAGKDAIFERFVQGDAGRAARRGVGLGLTICRRIVGAHGGVIWEDGTHGRGASFQILLPGAMHCPGSSPAVASVAALEPAT